MTTKNRFSSLQDSDGNLSFTQDSQFRNINLNSNGKSQENALIQSKSISFNSKDSKEKAPEKALDSISDEKKSENKNDGFRSKKSDELNTFDSKKNVQNQKWKKKEKDSKNGSTLSLHISAYENSVENGQNGSGETLKTNLKQSKFDKTLKGFSGSDFALKDTFEIPRQQSDKATVPEVAQFSASQKLINPNLQNTVEQNKIKVHVKLFVIDKNESKMLESGLIELEKETSLQNFVPIIFDRAQLSSEDYGIKSFLVLNKKSNEYITVADNYFCQPYDKFCLYLVKKEQHPTKITVTQIEAVQSQKSLIDSSNIKNIKELSEILSAKLDLKDGNVDIKKFDEDFGENIDVNFEEKFDPTKIYNIQISKTVKFDVVVEPDLTTLKDDFHEQPNGLKVGINGPIEEALPDTSHIPPVLDKKLNTTLPSKVAVFVNPLYAPLYSPSSNVEKEKVEEPQPQQSSPPFAEKVKLEMPKVVEKPSGADLVEEYEKKIEKFLYTSDNLENVHKNIYSRELILLVREIQKNFNLVPCPISENHLKQIGIDRSTMPPSVPVRSGYRSTFNVRGRGRGGTPWTTRNYSAFDNVGVHAAFIQPDNPHRINYRGSFPTQLNFMSPTKNDGEKSAEEKIEEAKKYVSNLLDKRPLPIYIEIEDAIVRKCDWKDENTIFAVAELIFNKAIHDQICTDFFAGLCFLLHTKEQNMNGENFKRNFHGALIRQCQQNVESAASLDIHGINETEKQRMIGVMKFVSHLFKYGLLNYKLIENCIVILIRNAERSVNEKELMIEYAITLMKSVRPFIDKRTEDTCKFDGYVTYLDKFKENISNRVKSMIIDLMERRDRKWII